MILKQTVRLQHILGHWKIGKNCNFFLEYDDRQDDTFEFLMFETNGKTSPQVIGKLEKMYIF